MLTIIRNQTDFYIEVPTVVSIGKFDGDHIGHQKIFETMRKIKYDKGLKTAVVTFNSFNTESLTTDNEKYKLLESEEIDYCVEYSFTEEIRSVKAIDFLEKILLSALNMRHIVAGTDCSFGYNREGNAAFLKRQSEKYGFEVSIIDKIAFDKSIISSSFIKELLVSGNIKDVNRLLGYNYSVNGKVSRGNHIGNSILGFPTCNIIPDRDKALPRSGVYATMIHYNGCMYHGMTNIGNNPSVRKDTLNHIKRIETYIFDFNKDIYDEYITIEFISFIREEKKFDSLDALKNQLLADELSVKKEFDR